MLYLLAVCSFARLNSTVIKRKAKNSESLFYGVVFLEGPVSKRDSSMTEYALTIGCLPMSYYKCMVDHSKCSQMCSPTDTDCNEFKQEFLTAKVIFALPFYVGLDSYIGQHVFNAIIGITSECYDYNTDNHQCMGVLDVNGFTKHHYSYESWDNYDDSTAIIIRGFEGKFDKARLKERITKLVHTPFNEPVSDNGWSMRTYYSMLKLNEIYLGTYNNADTVVIDPEYNDVDKGFENYVLVPFDTLTFNYGKSTNDICIELVKDKVLAGYVKASDAKTTLIVLGVLIVIFALIAIGCGVALCVTRSSRRRNDSSIDNNKA